MIFRTRISQKIRHIFRQRALPIVRCFGTQQESELIAKKWISVAAIVPLSLIINDLADRYEKYEREVIAVCKYSQEGRLDKIKQVVESVEPAAQQELVRKRHPGGWTALLAAAANDQPRIVEYLLDKGADVNETDEYNPKSTRKLPLGDLMEKRVHEFHPYVSPHYKATGWTALHYAAAQGNIATIKVLLARGADPDLKNNDGQTAEELLARTKGVSAEEVEGLAPYLAQARNTKAQAEKKRRLEFPLEKKLEEVMVGQKLPIQAVSASIRRRENGWYDNDKPVVFLFLGSSGVGKTMLAKQLAEHVVKDKENGFIRIDMSEYSSRHEVARFIGAPPGYVGYQEGGQLTERLAKCPNAVVLLDEVEKAHPDVFNLMLQVFDEGRLTDGKGVTIKFPEAIFILTSNLVQDEIRKAEETGYMVRPKTDDPRELLQVKNSVAQFTKKHIQPILKDFFKRDEFLGRINDIVIFHSFSQEDLKEITNKELTRWAKKAVSWHGIHFSWTPEVVESLMGGYDEKYGFRSIKYAVEKRVIDVIAAAHERDIITKGCSFVLALKDGEVCISDIKFSQDQRADSPSDASSLWSLFAAK